MGEDATAPANSPPELDLRMPLLGSCGWAGGLIGRQLQQLPAGDVQVAIVVAGTAIGVLGAWGIIAGVVARRPARAPGWTLAACLLAFLAVSSAGYLRAERVEATPVAALASRTAYVWVTGVTISDPRIVTGAHSDVVVLRVRLAEVGTRQVTYAVAAPVLVYADPSWADLALGSTVRFAGFLGEEADDPDLAATLRARGDPSILAGPPAWWRAADRVRASLRTSVEHRPPDQRELVPALVVGDDAGMDASVAADFRVTGLTHLLAVSGANLTLVVGALIVASRWLGARGRAYYVVGALGIAGFILLARWEPSVVRAAAMGAVGLVSLGVDGRRRGGRALGVAVLVVLLLEPALADSPGFAL